MMVSTVHTVQKLDCHDLDVSRMLRELLETSGGPGVPTSLNGALHHLCWDHTDVISVPTDINTSKEANKCRRSLTSIDHDVMRIKFITVHVFLKIDKVRKFF